MGLNRGLLLAAMALLFAAALLPEAAAVRYTVGGNKGWTQGVNYTIWAQDKKFYHDDWLFFVYDRNQMNVLEVNKTDYESCNTDHRCREGRRPSQRDQDVLLRQREGVLLRGHEGCHPRRERMNQR